MVTITVPDSLKNTDGSGTRTYAVIRVHDGQAVVLDDLDGGNTGVSSEENGSKADQNDNGPKTGDNTPIILYAFLAMIVGFGCLLMHTERRYDGMKQTEK